MMDIRFDRYSVILNGRRELIRSGAIHYFRLPHPSLWWDRLRKLKMAGYNTVDIYFNWDFHSKAPGQYDFTGVRDVKLLLDMIEQLGLYLIARPGPYINAETTRGGLPGWLLTEPDVILRNRQEGAYRYSPRYMAFVQEWFDQILPFLKGRDNLLMIQLENEYATQEMEPDYLEALLRIIRSHGISAPSMHNDFYAAGLYADLVDIYAIDNYSVTNFDWDWRSFPNLFSVMDHLEAGIRPEFCPDRPLMVAELQAGWFAGWKGVPYQTIHERLGREHIGLITRSFLGQGGTIFNHYKAAGGTNWDHIGATDSYTSYDFSAPISEPGLPTERLYEAKRINLLLAHFDLTQTDRVSPEELGLLESDSLYTVRKDSARPETYWIFTRNLTSQPLTLTPRHGIPITTPPYRAQIIPCHLPLENGWILEGVNVEPLAQTPHCLLLPGEQAVTLDLGSVPASAPVTTADPAVVSVTPPEADRCRIQLTRPLSPQELASVTLGDYHVHFLGMELADRLWSAAPGEYLIGPDMLLSAAAAYLAEERPCWRVQADGSLQSLKTPSIDPLALPELKDWTLLPGATELRSGEGFKALSEKGSDMDSNGYHEGAVWYRYSFEGVAECVSVHAQHIWALFLNGRCLLENHTFHVHPDTGGPEDLVTVQLPPEQLHKTGVNELILFVESLGHHKGFYDDTRDPRGVISLKLDGREIRQTGTIREATLQYGPAFPSATSAAMGDSPILHAVTEFTLSLLPDRVAPIGLQLDLDIERVNITLNNTLLGKYWRSCKNQTVFYLPEGILHFGKPNRLELTLMDFLPTLTIEKPFPMAYGKVNLVAYQNLAQLSSETVDMFQRVRSHS